MDKQPTIKHLDLKNVIAISRGDETKKLQYLNQFITLVTERTVKLKEKLQNEDRVGIRRILHSMRPQIQFFEIPEVVPQIERLELEYETIPIEQLKRMATDIMLKLDRALEEIKAIV